MKQKFLAGLSAKGVVLKTWLLSCLLLFVGGGNCAWAEASTITLNASDFTGTGSNYLSGEQSLTIGGIGYKSANYNPSTHQIRGNQSTLASNFYVYNTSPLPGAIKSITITATGNNIKANGVVNAYTSTSAITSNPNTTTATAKAGSSATNTITIDLSSNANKFFRIQLTNGFTTGTCTLSSISIQYESAPSVPCSVTFDAGSNGTCSTQSLTESSAGAGVTLPGVTANDGYIFKGWSTTENASIANAGVAGANYKPSSDCTLYAVYGNLYTVTLADNSATLTQTEENGNVTLPTREGNDTYTFAGWSITNNTEETTTAPTIISAGSYKPTANITLYPVYKRVEGAEGYILSENVSGTIYYMKHNCTGTTTKSEAETFVWNTSTGLLTYTSGSNTYYITHQSSGSTNLVNNITVPASGKEWTITENTTKKTVKFNSKAQTSRYLGTTGSGFKAYAATHTLNYEPAGTTYYISVIATQYDVKFYVGGEEQTGLAQKVVENGNPTSVTEPTKTGYTFDGWYEASDFSGDKIADVTSVTITDNKNFYGRFNIINYNITYNNVEGATHSNPATYTIETATINLAEASKDGYIFQGWFDNESFTGDEVTSIAQGSTGNKTFWAKWAEVPANPSTVTFNVGEHGTCDTESATEETVGAGVALPAVTANEGWVFKGWSTENPATAETIVSAGDDGMYHILANTTLYAFYKMKPATPTFSSAAGTIEKGTEVTISCTTKDANIYYTTNGDEPTAESTAYSEAITVSAAQTIKAIAILDGEQSDVATAAYTIAQHTAHFSINGVITDANNCTVAKGEAITFPADPTDIYGKKFQGWMKNATISGTQNDAPSMVDKATETMGTDDVTFYAVFAMQEGDGETTYTKLSSNSFDTNAEYVLAAEESSSETTLHYFSSYTGTTADESWGVTSTNADDAIVFTLSGTANALVAQDASGNYIKALTTGKFRMSSSSTNLKLKNNGQIYNPTSDSYNLRYNHNNGSGGFRWYNGSTGTSAYFYKKGSGTTLSDYCTTVVEPASLVSIAVSGEPAEFWKDDAFNHDGITVTATWSDESQTTVTDDCVFTGYDMSTAGQQTVTVTYQDKNDTYDIEVKTIANTQTEAYTVAEAKALIDAGKDLNTEVYVAGTISQIDSYNSTYNSITYWISADGTTTDQFEVFSGKGLNGANFSSKEDLQLGDEVIVKGKITLYNRVYEFSQNSQIASLTRPAREIENFIAQANVTVAINDNIDVKDYLNIPQDYAGGNEAISTSINGETEKAEEFTCLYNLIEFTKAGTYVVDVVAAADGGKYAETTGQITFTVTSATLQSVTIGGELTKTIYTIGENFDRSGLTVTANYSDNTHIDVTSEAEWKTDPVTLNTAGTVAVIVSASFDGKEDIQKYEVTVNKKTASISFAPATIEVEVGKNITLEPTTTPADAVISYTITEGSENVSIEGAVVTGVAEGTATIRADYAGNGEYAPASTTVTINVIPADPSTTVTYNFSSFTSATDVELTNLEGFVITLSKGGSSSNPAWSNNQARVYAGGSLTVKANNATIKSIEYSYVVNANKNDVVPTIDGVAGTTNAGSWDKENKTWTGADDEVTFSTSGSAGNIGFTKLVIKYIEKNLIATSLAWSADEAEVTIGADNNVFPTLTTTPVDLDGVTYESSNTDVATIAEDGTITLVKAGETTITANYAGDAEHASAPSASYTLTVNKAPLVPVDEGYETVDFAALYSSVTTNAVVEDYEGTSFSMAFAKPQSSTTPTKYYDNGKAVRAYEGNTITITGAENITNVDIAWVSGNVDDAVSYTGCGTTTVVVTFSKTCRFTAITVGYKLVVTPSDGVTTVTGFVTNTDVATVTADVPNGTAINMTDAYVSDDVLNAISTDVASKNILIYAPETSKSNATNVVVNGNCANLVLTDKVALDIPGEITATNITYDRGSNLAGGSYATIYLPYAFPVGDFKVMQFAGIEDGVVNFTFVDGTTAPNVPYVIRPEGSDAVSLSFNIENESTAVTTNTGIMSAPRKAARNDATGFYGTYEELKLNGNDGYYGFASGVFKKANTTSGTKITPFRAYLFVDGTSNARLDSFGFCEFDDATRVNEVFEAFDNNEPMYDLNGRRVVNPTRGQVVIMRGHKVMFK